MQKKDIINVISPALRGLRATGNVLAIVEYSAELAADAPSYSIPADAGTAEIVNILRDVDVSHNIINVKDIGAFTITAADLRKGRASGKVAFVTGAAQGFGFEIAGRLAEEGAMVVLGDINVDGVKSASEKINSSVGSEVSHGVMMNVTDADSVSDAVCDAVMRFGGIDVFVANAGIVRAGSVKDISERDFDLVTDINYKGYFLCVQNVAPIMSVQHMVRPESWCDIIQINSKSGLEGSNRNGAYSGSKFGGIGLTQSFALELVDDGIKVNSICPGNFLDGPLWSDPEKGLFAQYLRSGKVPGAVTIDDVRKFYEGKVPIGRGCTTRDVMHAVFYLMDQQYETGQALPVTGGQTMLK